MTIVKDTTQTFYYKRRSQFDSFVARNDTLSLLCPGTKVCNAVKGYKELIRKGSNATGAYSVDASTVESNKSGEWSLELKPLNAATPTNTESVSGFTTNFTLPGTIPTSSSTADSKALADLYKKIRSQQEKLNSLASAVEFGDVVRQFGAPFSAIVDLSNKHLNRLELERRGLKGSVAFKRAKWLRIVAASYLEYSFGLAPLIADTRAVAEAVAQFNNDESLSELTQRSKVVCRGEDQASSTSTTFTNVDSGRLWIRRTDKSSSVSRVQYIAGLQAVPHAPAFGSNERLRELLGIKPENIPAAVWEGIPWSWLADYFTNVQDILDSLGTSTASVAWVCKTVTVKHTRVISETVDKARTAQAVAAISKAVSNIENKDAYARIVRTVLTRTPNVLLGLPSLYFEYPTKWRQYANMAAALFARREKTSALWLF